MSCSLTKEDNNIITCTFDESVKIDVSFYNIINHNIMLMLPCTRDLSDAKIIHYDALGFSSLNDILQSKEYDKRGLFELIYQLVDKIEKIIAFGFDLSNIVFDRSYVFISDYDESIRWICLPVNRDCNNDDGIWLMFLKDLVLNINCSGAYDLVGFVIEKASKRGLSISDFKSQWCDIFSDDSVKSVNNDYDRDGNIHTISARVETQGMQRKSQVDITEKSSKIFTGREYVPEGMSSAFASTDMHNPSQGTQLLFWGLNQPKCVPYLTPVTDNSESSRIYITGIKFTIGRSSDNNLCINLPTISGKHAEIHITKDGCTLIDLNSTNKTYLNGKPINPNVPVKLNHHDTISFNKEKYIFNNC